MLKERTSSATQLRIESSLRHTIRNLRAKVRSFLPQQLCPKQIKQSQNDFLSCLPPELRENRQDRVNETMKKMTKELDKLTLQQLEEISSNKHYFLGNAKAIDLFENYVKLYHPEMKSKEFTIPRQPDPKEDLTLSFVPFNLTLKRETPSRQSRKSSSSFKLVVQQRAQTAEKRGSTTSAMPYSTFHSKKHSLVQPREGQTKSTPFSSFKEKMLLNQARKQDVEQNAKVRRQICYDYWKKQIQIVTQNKSNAIQEKVDIARFRHSSGSKIQNALQKKEKKKIEEHEVATLTSKLRKICLKRKKQGDNSEIR